MTPSVHQTEALALDRGVSADLLLHGAVLG